MATRETDFWNERAGPRIAPEHMGGILATAADLALVVSRSGTILSVSVNPLNSRLGRLEHWAGRNIRDFLVPDSEPKVLRELAAVADGGRMRADAIEINHIDGAEWDSPIRYTMHPTGREGRVLMLGRDMRPLAELQQRLMRAQMALERDHEALRIHETRFRALLAQTTDAFVLLDAANARVIEANSGAAALLGVEAATLVNAPFAQELENRRRSELIDALCAAGSGEAGPPVEARAARNGQVLHLYPRLFRNGGERVLLCRIASEGSGGDLRRNVRDARLSTFFGATADAVVFTDKNNQIVDANEAFLSLVDLDSLADLRGSDFADFLARGSVDLKVLTDRSGPRLHATRIVSAFGTRVSVEITPVALGNGHAFTLREADRLEPLRESDEPVPPDVASANARALVGTSPLRDIVASMTDVVEKECIEAAIEMTSNNRVAAAEMLGLSRQSLYVKLRKYGLLSRDE